MQYTNLYSKGQSISLTHLAPFVDVSRQKFRQNVIKENEDFKLNLTNEQIELIVKDRVNEEVKKGVQTIQYQVETLMTTNGCF